MIAPRKGWRKQAACRDAGEDWIDFFPASSETKPSGHARTTRRKTARRWCADCPVIADCGADADRARDIGIRGGALRQRENNSERPTAYRVVRLIEAAPASTLPGAHTVSDTADPPSLRAWRARTA